MFRVSFDGVWDWSLLPYLICVRMFLGSDLDLNPLVDQGFIIKNQLRAIGRLI